MQTKSRRSTRPDKRTKTATPAQIDRLRESYVETIALARKFNAQPSAMLDKAHRLLTRHWGKSDWASRAEILKTVDWLLQLAMVHPVPPESAEPAPIRLRRQR